MIKSIKIQNFKLFHSLTIEEIPKILLIGGDNNSGKTSILEAIGLGFAFVHPYAFIKFLNWRIPSQALPINNNEWFTSYYYNFDLNQLITIEYMRNSSKSKVVFKPSPKTSAPVVDERKNNIDKSLNVNLDGLEIEYWPNMIHSQSPVKGTLFIENNRFVLNNGQRLREAQNKQGDNIQLFFLSSTQRSASEEIAKIYGELDRINNTSHILEALKILEPKLLSLSIIPFGNLHAIYEDTGIGLKTTLYLMGQGINHLVSILLTISNAKNGIVLIDELENGIHYSVFPLFWETIAKHAKYNNAQIIATTHSRELIQGAVEGIPSDLVNDLQYMRIEKTEKNDFKIKKYNFDILKTALEANLRIR